jgi:hypothetical protein
MERCILFGVTDFTPLDLPAFLRIPAATLAAATNSHLMRRRLANSHLTHLPLQYDAPTIANRILQEVCQTATAMRDIARREEDRIYTHYEGWLPTDPEEWPTAVWQSRWSRSQFALLADTYPAAKLSGALPNPPPAYASPPPTIDLNCPALQARLATRSQQPNT